MEIINGGENGEEDNEDAIDRLSNLPDSVLHQILSLLPTLTVIRSSALSSHWRSLASDHLRHAAAYDFGDDFLRRLPCPDDFAAAVASLLRRHAGSRIRSFRLTFNPGAAACLKSAAAGWVLFAAARGVEDLDLDFRCHIRHHFLSAGDYVIGRSDAFELPSASLFSCAESLTRLSLSRCILPADLTGFRWLRSLSLRDVHVTNAMLESLLHSSSVLEKLVVRECGSLTQIRIRSQPRLEALTIYECPNASSVEISGRMIRSVLLSAGHLDSCVLEDIGALEQAFIGTRGDEFGGVLYIFMKSLSSFSHVRKLALYLGHLVPSLVKDVQVSFSNLRELELVNSQLFGLFSTDVFCFFRHCSCPVLENVTVVLSTISNNYEFELEFRTPKITPPDCVFERLKKVELSNFGNNENDMDTVTFFLERSPVLDEMVLVPPQISDQKKGQNSKNLINLDDMILELHKNEPSVRIINGDRGGRDGLLHFLRKHQVADVYSR